MPARQVRPRASQAPTLGAGAVMAYRETGWHFTAHGNLDTGGITGPCTRCDTPCVRYGPAGRPLCNSCLQETT